MNFQVEKTKLKHPGAILQCSGFQFNCDGTFLQCSSICLISWPVTKQIYSENIICYVLQSPIKIKQ